MPSGWEATGEVRWSSRWAASTRCVNLLLAKNPPCIPSAALPLLQFRPAPSLPVMFHGSYEWTITNPRACTFYLTF